MVAIRGPGSFVCSGDGMSKRTTSVVASPAAETPPELSPGELLLRAFNDLRDELVSTLWFMLGNRDDAQDVAQEAFLRCWRTQEGLPEIQNLRAWIFRVGLNAAKDLQRSAWRRRVKPLMGAESMPLLDGCAPIEALEEQEAVAQLRRALMHLRPEEKEVFLLRQNGELTYEQIAELHDRPVGTVKTQMRSALQKLRKVLNPELQT
jgi:RNA polymerase sigma-70 factor (ECF subfamily)